jgi:hypothetical protein
MHKTYAAMSTPMNPELLKAMRADIAATFASVSSTTSSVVLWKVSCPVGKPTGVDVVVLTWDDSSSRSLKWNAFGSRGIQADSSPLRNASCRPPSDRGSTNAATSIVGGAPDSLMCPGTSRSLACAQ